MHFPAITSVGFMAKHLVASLDIDIHAQKILQTIMHPPMSQMHLLILAHQVLGHSPNSTQAQVKSLIHLRTSAMHPIQPHHNNLQDIFSGQQIGEVLELMYTHILMVG